MALPTSPEPPVTSMTDMVLMRLVAVCLSKIEADGGGEIERTDEEV